MRKKHIPCRQTGYFSHIICDYLDEAPGLRPFYNRFPRFNHFKEQMKEKAESFPVQTRKVLTEVLREQYRGLENTEAVLDQINRLEESNTYTVVTGHQLNLFTGPLYFLYKIADAVLLAKKLNASFPENHVVPVYWMATEDHDFEEISYFNYKGKKFQWNGSVAAGFGGAVGRMTTEGLEGIAEVFRKDLGISKNAKELSALFTEVYTQDKSLAEATRELAHRLFGSFGLVILDADDRRLKSLFVSHMKADVFDHLAFQKVTEAANALDEKGYSVQVNPREINLFYLSHSGRNRIAETEKGFAEVDGTRIWTRETLEAEMETSPERFSPNVLLRPLYQECILPNLCYIGGGGELAYWLELKSFFDASKVPFPVLLLRNSLLLIPERLDNKRDKLGISYEQLFLDSNAFINRKVREISNIDIDFSPQRAYLKEQFEDLYRLAEQTDPSFIGAVKAQEVKQLKGLDHLEKRLLKAQKRKLSDEVERMTALRGELFPNGGLQERVANFAEFYEEFGEDLIPMLMEEMDPLLPDMTVLVLPHIPS